MTDAENELTQDIAKDELQASQLALLFGRDIVEQARLVDIADLNMTDQMAAEIGAGIKQLKQLRESPEQQRQWLEKQESGLQLLLCLWVMDMGLLEKIIK
jgi:3-oxoacyl-(acyl-carrier-protein) synthase